MKKSIIVVGIILALFLSGCTANQVKEGGEVSVKQPTNQSEQVGEEIAPSEISLNIGETATTEIAEITISSVEQTKLYENTYAKTGKKFVVVELTQKNIGEDSLQASPFNLSLTDSEGNKYDQSYFSNILLGNDKAFSPTTLYKNQKRSGTVIFEINASATGLEAVYDLGAFFKTRLIKWKIPNKEVKDPTVSGEAKLKDLEYSWIGSGYGGYLTSIPFELKNTGEGPISIGLQYKITDITIKNNPQIAIEGKDSLYDASLSSWKTVSPSETINENVSLYASIKSAGTYKVEITIIDKNTGKEVATAEKEQKIPQA